VSNLKFRLPGWTGATAEPVPALAGAPAAGLQSIPIRGLTGDLPVHFGEGGAVPGDKIVGILTPERGIEVFPIHSPKLKAYDDHGGWIDVAWDIDESRHERFATTILVMTLNQPGSLAQIAQVIGGSDGNIDNVRMVARAADFTQMEIRLEVWDLDHLNDIMAGLKAVPVVSEVARQFSET
jgi:(p)ppGpp synthase/HD superfamily hydrolase